MKMKKLIKLFSSVLIIALCVLNISNFDLTEIKDVSLNSIFKMANAGCEDEVTTHNHGKKTEMTCPTGDGGTFKADCCDTDYTNYGQCYARSCESE